MKTSSYVLALLAFGAAGATAAEFDFVALSPKDWPGHAPEKVSAELKPVAASFLEAMRAGAIAALNERKAKLISILGGYAGVPEERPNYGQPIEPQTPDFKRISGLWDDVLSSQKGRYGWEVAARLQTSPGAGGKVPRLRVSQRQISALLRTHEAGLDPTGKYLKAAIAGLDYLLSTQTSGGAFGYPYEPGGPGLRVQAAASVVRGEKMGLKMVERDWIVEDLGDGGLNFDNGMCGAVLLHGYVLTGDTRYLEAAKRAGEWARTRKLALNFNYNGFSGMLLSRLFRVTGDKMWLEAAKPIVERGVLIGQMPNGRWFDQHNAKIQYHAILCWQTAEYLFALRAANAPSVSKVEDHLRRGLNNLATEINHYGTNNADEAISLEALISGSFVVGADPAWTRAINTVTNYVSGPFAEVARSHGVTLPDPLACYFLFRAHEERSFTPAEGMTVMRGNRNTR